MFKRWVAHLNGLGEQALEPGHLKARNDERGMASFERQ
ncbi:Uncharacterised protein [Salmonella enterica subsp. enterica]|uniref:Uncharacterized protein n=1 Tax=Salmonella enterica I TaxID=59201 RepID=A0A379VP52_SALET|nr:Uncharacterised protein [Salmonella enterica subsp. enterica]